MLGLHYLDIVYFEYIDDFLDFNNALPVILTFLFFAYFVLILLGRSLNYQNSIIKYKKILYTVFWFLILLLWVVFFFKFYLNYRFFSKLRSFPTYICIEENILWNLSLFGDTLILLCITTLIISWLFLSERYIKSNPIYTSYFFIFIVFTINMVYTKNVLTMFLFFEFIFLPSLFFVYVLGYSKKVERTVKYLLLWTLTGSFICLVAIIYLFSISGSLHIFFLMEYNFTSMEYNMLFFLFFIGFGIKIPVWPFHYWLTKVHVEAPTGFSIFLSGYLVKTALFCLITLFEIFNKSSLVYFALTIVIWGAIESSFRMWTATDIKRLIAFATIQEMNVIMIFMFLSNYLNCQILNSFILIHGLLSALLFFLIDQVQKRYQTRNLTSLSGLACYFSFLPLIMWAALLIFRGFPIFVKFLIEWELLVLLFEHYGIIGFFIFFLLTYFAVLGFGRIWFIILYGQPSHNLRPGCDMLKTDKLVSLLLISLLQLFLFMLFLFN